MKRILSLLVAMIMALGCVGITAMAEDAAVATISTVDELVAFRDSVNGGNTYEGKTVTLATDLNLSSVTDWTPIGTGTRSSTSYTGNAFKGTFDGAGNTISGLSISSTTGDNAAIGLFGVVDGGTVKDLKLTDVNIDVANSDLAGGAIGMMLNNATADNITVSGSVTGNDGVGGVVGRMIINGTISNCTNNASVTSSYGGIGGVVGKAYYEDSSNTSVFGTISGCTNNGTITAPMYIGGIVGLARCNVTGCTNNGAVVGGTQTGGVIGQLIAAGAVSGNVNNAKISGKNHMGGIIGDYTQSTAYTYYNVSITDNINRGELAATEQCAAIMGCNNIDGFTNMTASGNVSYYNADGLELFGNPEDMVIDNTNKFEIAPVAQIGSTTYTSVADALAVAAETGAAEVKILQSVRELLEDDLFVTIKSDLTITADSAVTVDFYNNGTDYDLVLDGTNGEDLTIAENVTLTVSDRIIWIGYGGNNIDVIVNGSLIGGYQLWFGGDVTVSDTGTVGSKGEALVGRRGATLAINGGTLEANYFSLISGTVELNNATATTGPLWLSSNSEGAGEIILNNSSLTSSGNLEMSGGASVTVTDGSELSVVGGEFGNSIIGEGCTLTIDTSSSVTANAITGAGAINIDASGFDGTEASVLNTAGMSGFTGNVSVVNNSGADCEISEDGKIIIIEKVVENVAEVNGTKYTSLTDAENAAKDGDTIVLLADIELDKMVTFYNAAGIRNVTLNMNGKTITLNDNWPSSTSMSAFWICDNLTITGNGKIIANPANEDCWAYVAIVGQRQSGTTNGTYEGNLVIENGEFYSDDSSVVSVTYGSATINGGTFESADKTYTLNCVDEMRGAGKASITVKGGTFVGFNPSNNAAEGAGTNFCAEGYAALPDLDGNYVVGARPTATVNNLGSMVIPAGEYSNLSLQTVYDKDMPLNFVMQFIADETEEAGAASPYAEWYADFVLSFTGIENGSFTADGCYLAGYYEPFGWVQVPVDGMTVTNGDRFPVMLGYGAGQKYQYICGGVQNFQCAMYIDPEILEANPNLKVKLELVMVDNSKGSDAAINALVNQENVYSVNEEVYTAEDFVVEYVADIDGTKYMTLEDAIAAAQNDDTITLLTNVLLDSDLNIDKPVTLNGNGNTITGNVRTNADVTLEGVLNIIGNYYIYAGTTIIAEGADVDSSKTFGIWDGGKLTVSVAAEFSASSLYFNGGAIDVKGKLIATSGNDGGLILNGEDDTINIYKGGILDVSYVDIYKITGNSTVNVYGEANVSFKLSDGSGKFNWNIVGGSMNVKKNGIVMQSKESKISVDDGSLTAINIANNGTVNVSGTSDIAANVTGDGWVYMNRVTLDADTKLYGAKVRFASGTNNVNGSVIDDGFFQVGIGAYNGVDTNVDTANGVTVNVKNATIGSNGNTYAGWVGTGFYDTDDEKADAMTGAKYVLNIENSIAEFGYLHISNDGELNVNGNAAEKAHYNNSDYSFYAGDFIINGTATFDATDVLALYTKVSCDNGTENPGTLNIVNGTEYEAERHNGAVSGTNFVLYKTGVANVDEASKLHIGECTSIADNAVMNIGGTATALGTITNNGTINLTTVNATITTPEEETLVVNSTVAGYEVDYTEGKYILEKVEKFDFYGSNVVLGNSLSMDFYVADANLNGTNYYAEIKHYAEDKVITTQLPYNEWEVASTGYHKFSYSNLAAKQIADKLEVAIFTTDGTQVSVTREDGLRAYAFRAYDAYAGKNDISDSNLKLLTAVTDMLNYGAAAQVEFNYNTNNLANAGTEDYQQYATATTPELEDIRVKDDKVYGTNVTLKDNIILSGYFADVTSDMYAKITFTDHYGNPYDIRVEYSEFKPNGSYYQIDVDELAIADAAVPVTITVYNANDTKYSEVVESVNSYLCRAMKAYPDKTIFAEIAEFAASALAALNNK